MDGRTEVEAAAGEGATPVDAESDRETETEAEPGAHLDGIEDGCGCAEVWEHMSDRRAED